MTRGHSVRSLVKTILAAGIVAFPAVPVWGGSAEAAPVSGAGAPSPSDCVTLHVRATPRVNAQNAPFETIRSHLTSCSTGAETVTLVQRIGGPLARPHTRHRSWTIVLAPHQTMDRVEHIPYRCCGSYIVTDEVRTSSDRRLARAQTGFTFA
jgi:hypothetical protein